MEDVPGRDIHGGTELDFVWQNTDDGPRATHVRVIKKAKSESNTGTDSQDTIRTEHESPAANASPTDEQSIREFLNKYDKLTHLYHEELPPDKGPIQTSLGVFALEEYEPTTRVNRQNKFSRSVLSFAKYGDDSHFEYFLSRIRDLLFQRFLLDDVDYDYITVYPGHTAGKLNPQLVKLAQTATVETSLLYSPLLERTETATKQRAKSRDKRMDVARDPGKTVRARNELSNDIVLLMDDVCTSGASLLEGAYLLRNAGARQVVGLCLGFTSGGNADTITIEDRSRRASDINDIDI